MNAVLSLVASGSDVLLGDKEGSTAIHLSCFLPTKSIAKYLIEYKEEVVGIKDYKGRTPLHAAAHSLNIDICKELLKAKADINAQDYQGRTPLLWCLSQSKQTTQNFNSLLDQCIRFLIQNGATIQKSDNNQRNIIHYASYYALQNTLQYFIDECNFSIDSEDLLSQTPIFSAISSIVDDFKTETIVEILLNAGANPFQISTNKYLPLHVAILMNQYSTANTIFEYMEKSLSLYPLIKLDELFDKNQKSILQYCAENSMHILAIDIFNSGYFSLDSIFNHLDSENNSIWHSIAMGGSIEIFEFFIKKTQKNNQFFDHFHSKNNKNRNILHISAGLDHLEFIQEVFKFLDKDQQIQLLKSTDRFGFTPVHYAALRGCFYVLDYFVNSIPDCIHFLSCHNQTVLHACVSGSAHSRCLHLLLDAGSNVNAIDKFGRSPIFYTLRKNNSRIDLLRVLLEDYSADISICDSDGHSFAYFAANSDNCSTIMELVDEFDK